MLGEAAGTKQREVLRESKAAAKQVSRRSHTSNLSAPGTTGERQEHLDAIVFVAGAGQRRRLFRRLDILTIKWVIGDLQEQCRFRHSHASSSSSDADTHTLARPP